MLVGYVLPASIVGSLACARDDHAGSPSNEAAEISHEIRYILTDMRCLPMFAVSILSASSGFAQLNESSSLREVEFSQLSQRDPNPLAEKAFAIQPEQWKHAETEHFIYHFVHSYVATPVSVEAEFHYRVVAKELERAQAPGDIKSN